MPTTLSAIEKEASQLSHAEREALARKLFDSVHNSELNEIDESWLILAEERFENLKSGEDKGLSEKAFFDRLHSQI